MNGPKRALERAILFILGKIPARLAHHVLFLVGQRGGLADRWGYHVRPIHFYDPVPDFRNIPREHFGQRRVPVGIRFDLGAQVARLERFAAEYGGELQELARAGKGGFDFTNEYFAGLDAALYYSVIRDLQPRKVLEIGGGYSTQIAARALGENEARGGARGELVVVEPFPQDRLTAAGLRMRLLETPVENVQMSEFEALGDGDILFIDSSHVVKCRNDVFVEFLEILPRLKPGVWVHIHDIFFPYDYPEAWVLEKRIAFNEQYLLEAFLTFNAGFTVAFSNHWLERDHRDDVDRLIRAESSGVRMPAASFWMVRK